MPSFRPHHFLCAYCFQGKGYSAKFIHNFNTIMTALSHPEGEETLITITPHTDDICSPCPHRRHLECESETKIRYLDTAHSEAFNLEPHTSLTWKAFKQRLHERLTIEKFHLICVGCEWKAYGICESILRTSGIK